jgi:hypothetical protein
VFVSTDCSLVAFDCGVCTGAFGVLKYIHTNSTSVMSTIPIVSFFPIYIPLLLRKGCVS